MSGATLRPAAPGDVLRAAEHAVTLASVEPARARDTASSVLSSTDDVESRVVAERALGLAYKELGDLEAAVRHLEAAVDRARRNQLAVRTGQALMSLVAVRADLGDFEAALADADQAAGLLRGSDAGRLAAQRAQLLQRGGRFDESIACYEHALPAIREAGDVRFEAGALVNLGVLYVYRGDIERAKAELERCEQLATAAGLDQIATLARSNLAFAALRGGDIPRALALIDETLKDLAGSDGRQAVARVDRAEALMSAHLIGEARTGLEEAIRQLDGSGHAAAHAEARLTLARAELLDGAAEAAVQTARSAREAFTGQQRTGWAVLAEHVELLARWRSGERTRTLLESAAASSDQLAAWGWDEAARHSRVLVGRLALHLGRLDLADQQLTEAARGRRSGPVELRVAAWHATALLRLAHGHRAGSLAALRAGLRVVHEHAASLGATDLRTHAAGWGQELARLGMRLAVESGRARSVLDWVERWRASAMRLRPVRPPGDPRLAHDLAELRRVTAQLAEAAAEGNDSRTLRAKQVRLEEGVRSRWRHARPVRQVPLNVSIDELSECLTERAFVSFAHHNGDLAAVTVVAGRTKLTPLCGNDEAIRATAAVRFFLHRLARRHGSAASLAAAAEGLRHASSRLDALLLSPVAASIGDRELVVSPTGWLHAAPWSALPSLSGRPITIAPSATAWVASQAAECPRTAGPPVLVSGPGLHHSHREVGALAGLYPDAIQLIGADARAERVRDVLGATDLCHIAAHGRFRADNPLFSSLDLADGPLMVYDLERLEATPRRLVLSACEAGLSAVRPGDELMGLVSAVLSLGTGTLVASVSPVHDEEARDLMLAFHTHLAGGARPSHALADAARSTGVQGFVCFGAG